MQFLKICTLGVLGLLSVGCGGGGGGDALNNGSTPPPPSVASLGSRALPGYLLSVDADGPLDADAPRSITLTVVPDAGIAAPTFVEAALDGTEPTAWIPGQATADPLRWRWDVVLPSPIDGQRLWLRVTDADGNVAESGFADFALGR